MNIAMDRKEEARRLCNEWIDKYGELEVTSQREYERSGQVDACIQSLKDAILMTRLADSIFIKTAAPSLEYLYKAFAARMLKDDENAYREFVNYKQRIKEQKEEDGYKFEEVWEELKQIPQDIRDFEIPDNDPPLAKLVDDYIEKYGK